MRCIETTPASISPSVHLAGDFSAKIGAPIPELASSAVLDSPLGLAILDYIFLARDAYRLRVKAFTATAEV